MQHAVKKVVSMQHAVKTLRASYRCDSCQAFPIVGRPWHCNQCAEFDLCARCHQAWGSGDSEVHDTTHTFRRIEEEEDVVLPHPGRMGSHVSVKTELHPSRANTPCTPTMSRPASRPVTPKQATPKLATPATPEHDPRAAPSTTSRRGSLTPSRAGSTPRSSTPKSSHGAVVAADQRVNCSQRRISAQRQNSGGGVSTEKSEWEEVRKAADEAREMIERLADTEASQLLSLSRSTSARSETPTQRLQARQSEEERPLTPAANMHPPQSVRPASGRPSFSIRASPEELEADILKLDEEMERVDSTNGGEGAGNIQKPPTPPFTEMPPAVPPPRSARPPSRRPSSARRASPVGVEASVLKLGEEMEAGGGHAASEGEQRLAASVDAGGYETEPSSVMSFEERDDSTHAGQGADSSEKPPTPPFADDVSLVTPKESSGAMVQHHHHAHSPERPTRDQAAETGSRLQRLSWGEGHYPVSGGEESSFEFGDDAEVSEQAATGAGSGGGVEEGQKQTVQMVGEQAKREQGNVSEMAALKEVQGDLPKTNVGKILRRELRDLAAEG